MNNELFHKINHVIRNIKHTNPQMLIILVVIVLIFFVFLATLSSGSNVQPTSDSFVPVVTQSQSSSNGAGMVVIETIMWGVFIFLLLINGLQYLFNINIKTAIKDIFSEEPEVDITVEKKPFKKSIIPDSRFIKQVFHVPDNNYNYEDAKAVCKAFDSELATYDQIEQAYTL